MRIELVAVDLETTGLNVDTDAIIEIGAVKLLNGEIVDQFSTLVNPGFALPPETTYITGIRQEDLRGMPILRDVLPDLVTFIGNATLIAHNAAFDVTFLRRFGIVKSNPTLDTLELASLLLPKMPRYGLGGLTTLLNIPQDDQHRALADAKATALLYLHLWERACQLPASLLQELITNGQLLGWDLTAFFQAALANTTSVSKSHNFAPYTATHAPLRLSSEFQAIDTQAIRAALDEHGTLAQKLPSFEQRPEQIAMAEAVAEAMNDQKHLIVEAGTGTGKSLAYLLPAAQWASQNEQRVVVATNTINLQEQLLNKDMPVVQSCLDAPVVASLMKGRANYLCPRRLEAIRRRRPNNLDELRLLTKIMVWLEDDASGDRGEITLRANENPLWSRISAEDEGCTTHQCETLMRGVCPFYKARKKADTAHILVVNHALLMSDATSENRVLPDFDFLIVDEAHQLEEAVTSALTVRSDQTTLLRRLADLGDVQHGVLGDLLKQAHGKVNEKQYLRLESFAIDIGSAVKDMSALVRSFFNSVNEWLGHMRREGTTSIRINKQERGLPNFSKVLSFSGKLDEYLEIVSEAMSSLAGFLGRLTEANITGYDDHVNSASSAARYFAEARTLIFQFAQQPDAKRVYWVDLYTNLDYTAIQAAPLEIGSLVEESLWSRKRSVIMTSATLETNDSFDFLKARLSAQDVHTVKIGSPFDYLSSTLLYLPNDLPEPNKPNYQQQLERGIIELATALEGRLLVLFTSYGNLRETAANVGPRLALGNITIYDQAMGGSRETLLDAYRTTPRAVLMGTRSFWQGVDLPGNELLGLIIVKLPFAVPTDPIFSARSETYRNSFDEYTIPDAILRFRQGFGRLVRSKTDRGIVGIFDSRVTSKGYGKQFLESLPDCTVKHGTVAQIGQQAKLWLSDRLRS